MTTVIHSCPVWLPQTQTWMYNLVRFLPSDIDAQIVCDRSENLDQFGVPKIHCLTDKSPWRRVMEKGIRSARIRNPFGFTVNIARSQGAQILHSHFGHIGWVDMTAARQAKLRHVVSFYGLDVNYLPLKDPRWRRRYRALFDHVDAVLCEGPHMGACVAALDCPESKLHIHRLGADIDTIPFRPFEWSPGNPLRVLIAASFREKKGIPNALAALGQLRHTVPLEITLIGDAGAEPRAQKEKAAIQDAIRQYELGERISQLGYQPHERLMEEARRHHVFLSPSLTASDGDTEGGAPVSLIDMAASGMVIVSTRHCDIPEIVCDGQTGLLAAENDVAGLVTKLEWLVAHPEAWSEMRVAARRHVEAHYSASVQAESLAKIYRALVT